MKRVGQFAVVLAAVASFFAWGTEGFAAEPIKIAVSNVPDKIPNIKITNIPPVFTVIT